MNPDEFSSQCRSKHNPKNNSQQYFTRVGALESRLPKPTWQLWFDDEEHQRDKDQYESEIEGCSTYTGCSGDSHHEGQHAPCSHIIYRSARRGGTSERRFENTAVLQDTNQHREGGDAHGDPHKQGEGKK